MVNFGQVWDQKRVALSSKSIPGSLGQGYVSGNFPLGRAVSLWKEQQDGEVSPARWGAAGFSWVGFAELNYGVRVKRLTDGHFSSSGLFVEGFLGRLRYGL